MTTADDDVAPAREEKRVSRMLMIDDSFSDASEVGDEAVPDHCGSGPYGSSFFDEQSLGSQENRDWGSNKKQKVCGGCEGCNYERCNDCSFCKRNASYACIFGYCDRVENKKNRNQEAWKKLDRKEDKTSLQHQQVNGEIDPRPPGRAEVAHNQRFRTTTSQRRSSRRRISSKKQASAYSRSHSPSSGENGNAQPNAAFGINFHHIATVPDTTDNHSKTHQVLRALAEKRCNSCTMCLKTDCGLCTTCVRNKTTTSPFRLGCLLKACSGLPRADKVLPLPGFPPAWGFYFADSFEMDETLESMFVAPFLPTGLRLVLQQENNFKEFTRMTNVARECGYSKATMESKLEKFCSETLGIRYLLEAKHTLLNKRILQQWTDLNGALCMAYGTITECTLRITGNAEHPERTFRIEYEPSRLGDPTSFKSPLAALEHVPEKLAWGAHICYLEKMQLSAAIDKLKGTAPYFIRWILPDRRYVDERNRVVMTVNGFQLIFSVEDSAIPGAGLGLFLKVTDLTDEGRKEFVLRRGELLDMGAYAPLRQSDRKTFHINIFKSFIYDWKNYAYSFDANGPDNEVFDVTDDKTGVLHDKAAANVLMRVNETDGVAIPQVLAETVPSGGINYYLGHGEKEQGELRIKVDRRMEIKIDYGDLYEPVRVREGYPRISGVALESLKKAIHDEDIHAMDDMSTFTCNDVDECLVLLQSLFTPSWAIKRITLLRCLAATLALLESIQAIREEFANIVVADSAHLICDNGYSNMKAKKLEERARAAARKLFWHLGSAEEIKLSLAEMEDCHLAVVRRYFGTNNLDTFDYETFRSGLQSPTKGTEDLASYESMLEDEEDTY